MAIGGPLSGKAIISIAAGGHHSAAIAHPGVLYTWGGSSFGKLGHGNESVAACLVPKLVAGLSHIRLVQVALGQHHSAALAANGDVYVWGKSQGTRCEDIWTPEKVSGLSPITSIACAKNGILFAISNTGDVFIRGPMSADMQIITAGFVPASDSTGETNRQQLYVLAGKGIVKLAAGNTHCIAMADPSCNSDQANPVIDTADTVTTASSETTANATRPSLYHILESVVKAVPPPPSKPCLDDEIAFLSGEVKLLQSQNQKLAVRIQEAFARIAHLERENTTLREELDASTHCLPVDGLTRLSPRETDASNVTAPLIDCETVHE
jgi:hypothetical protein